MILNKLVLLIYAIHLAICYAVDSESELQQLNQKKYNLVDYSSNFSLDNNYIANKSDLDNEISQLLNENEPYSLPIKITLSTLATTTSLVTISGNLLVMFSFFLDRQIRNPTNYFILSLSVSDFLIGMFSMPLYTLYLMLEEWPFGEIICNLWLSLDYTVCLTSIYTVLFITIDRFCSVKIPAKYRKWRSPNKIIVMVVLTWVVPSSLFFTSIFAWSFNRKFDPKNCDVAWKPNVAFSLILMFAYFWSTLAVIIILYVFIYQVARDLEKKHRDKQSKVNALVGTTTVSRAYKTVNSDKNFTQLNMVPNNTLKIPSTIPEKSAIDNSENSNNSKLENEKSKKFKTKEIIQIEKKSKNQNNLNSSFASTISKEDFSSDSHSFDSNKNLNSKNSPKPDLSSVDLSAQKCASQISSNAAVEKSPQITADTVPILLSMPLVALKNDSKIPVQQIPFIDDEFEELNYVLHRRQFGNENKLPIKEETILIKSPLKNGFFQKISLSIKSFSRRSSQKSLIDISSGNDSNEKSKLESLKLKNDKKQLNDTKKTVLNEEEKVNLLNEESKKPNVLNKDKPQDIKPSVITNTSASLPNSKINDNVSKNSTIRNHLSVSSAAAKSVKEVKKKPAKYENRARKALRTITFILGAFVFCFAPFHVVSAFDLFCTVCWDYTFYKHFFNTCYFLCYLNSPINPFMYALANQQFKKTFLRILKGDFRRS